MAAHIKFKQGHEKTWHVGEKAFERIFDIQDVVSVQIDSYEAELLYGAGIELQGERVHVLTGNEAKLYCVFLFWHYASGGRPTVTEEGINTFLQGRQNPKRN